MRHPVIIPDDIANSTRRTFKKYLRKDKEKAPDPGLFVIFVLMDHVPLQFL